MYIDRGLMPIHETILEVAEEPMFIKKALAEKYWQVVNAAESIIKHQCENIFILGNGDSYFCGQMVQLAFENWAGFPIEVPQGYEFALYGSPLFTKKSAAIVISSSGRVSKARETLDQVAKSDAFKIGLTDNNSSDNPFIEKTDIQIIPEAKKKGWPTQTTLTSAVLLIGLSIELGRLRGCLSGEQYETLKYELMEIPNKLAKALDSSKRTSTSMARGLANCPMYSFVGSGPGVGIANLGVALMNEAPQIAAVSYQVEEYHHSLRFSVLSPQNIPVLIALNGKAYPRFIETAESIVNWGVPFAAVVNEGETTIKNLSTWCFEVPSLPEPMSALTALPPLHQWSIDLTDIRLLNGYRRTPIVP